MHDLDHNFFVELHGMSRFHFCMGPTSQGSSEDVTMSVEAVLGRLLCFFSLDVCVQLHTVMCLLFGENEYCILVQLYTCKL